jgi:hypothetical protein
VEGREDKSKGTSEVSILIVEQGGGVGVISALIWSINTFGEWE